MPPNEGTPAMTTTTVESDLALTRDDLNALHGADDVTLHLNRDGSYMRAYCRAYGQPPTFSRRQQVLYPEHHTQDSRMRTIATTASAVGYSVDGGSGWRWDPGSEGLRPSCFASVYDNDLHRSIFDTLRVGDTLHVSWTADNNNEPVRTAGLHVDNVHLIVNAGTSTRRRYLLAYSVCYDNSARMIRR